MERYQKKDKTSRVRRVADFTRLSSHLTCPFATTIFHFAQSFILPKNNINPPKRLNSNSTQKSVSNGTIYAQFDGILTQNDLYFRCMHMLQYVKMGGLFCDGKDV